MPLDVEKIRRDFPMLAPVPDGGRPFVYLDSGASSQTPEPVLAAMDDYYRTYRANVHRGMYRASELATERYESARARVAAFIGAREDEVIFTSGATHGLNLAAQLLAQRVVAGDEIVATEMEHHANLIPWQQLAKAKGATLRLIPVRDDCTLDLDAAKALIGPKTKVVAVTWGSNVLGTINPADEVCALARAAGAFSVVDAAQYIGHRAVDVKKAGCDFLAFSGHKMLGPTGTGALFGRHELLETLEPVAFGGDMIREVFFTDALWSDAPFRFEPGTPNVAGVIGLGAAVDYLTSLGVADIAAHERDLTAHALAALAEISGTRVFGPPAGHDRLGAVAFTVEGIHPHDVATVLDARGVCVRAGHHCAMPLHRKFGFVSGTARMSLGPYTTAADVDALADGVRHAKKIFRV